MESLPTDHPEALMSTHAELLARHRAVLPSWIALSYEEPISLVSGAGRHVTDAEGNTYLDFFGGILTTSIGHNIEEITDAILSQAGKILHTSTLYLIEPEIELAEKIAAKSGITDARVFFTNSGSEANDTALLLATTYRRSSVVLALRNSYHGRSFGAMAVTGNRSWSASPLSPVQVTFVDAGGRGGPFDDRSGDELVAAVRRDVEHLFTTAIPADPACLIIEPVQGVGGFITPVPGVLRAIGEVVNSHGGLLISDEVQTGWGRTGASYFGFGIHALAPEMLTFAKGLANGLPIGGVVAPAEVMNCIGSYSISTFGGNPLVAVAANATLDYIDRHDLPTHVATVGTKLKDGLRALCAEVEWIYEVRGLGLMLAIELVESDRTTPDPKRAMALLEALRDQGVLVGRGGLFGNVLRIAPPMSVTEDEIVDALGRFEIAIRHTQKLSRAA
jgi:4-aminobutyrate aminotransferase